MTSSMKQVEKVSFHAGVRFQILFLTIIALSFSFTACGQTPEFPYAMKQYRAQNWGEFASGELAYIANGKNLGTESYTMSKQPDGKVVVESEGVFTIPTPIPFIKPKVKLSQTITVTRELHPVSLFLQYKGPLGIGSQKISISLNKNKLQAKAGNNIMETAVDPAKAVFVGAGSSQALFALILAQREDQVEFTEIKTRSGDPGSEGDNQQLKAHIILLEKEEVQLHLNKSLTQVTKYTFKDVDSGTNKSVFVREGSFIAFQSVSSGNSFCMYRSDLLAKDFQLTGC